MKRQMGYKALLEKRGCEKNGWASGQDTAGLRQSQAKWGSANRGNLILRATRARNTRRENHHISEKRPLRGAAMQISRMPGEKEDGSKKKSKHNTRLPPKKGTQPGKKPLKFGPLGHAR